MVKKRSRLTRLKELPDHIKAIAGVITAVGVILSALVGFCGYVETLIVSEVTERLDGLDGSLSEVRKDTVRLQLLSLIHNDPENTESILKVAHEYFVQLNGDWYVTQIFTEWAEQRGIDIQDFGALK